MPHYTPDQINLGIIAEGQRRGITEKGICIAISTGLVESNSTMYANPNDPESLSYPHDAIGYDANSVGVFQQRDPWWGTCHDRMHVEPSAGMFYAELVKQDYNSDAHTPGWYAQQVQQSAYPDRYDERYDEACDIYARLTTTGAELVGEKLLDYDETLTPQETGYWCGPASAQVALSCRGIFEQESVLAAEMGTDEGGTDYVALIERSLDPRLPEANYSSHDAPNDPPLPHQLDAFWDALKRSIDNGFAVVLNWVAPPSNYPIGIKGSVSPSYGGGTIYHYVTAAGYDDNPAQRAVWIADSGFPPFGYWISFDQCATLIPPKAFCYADLPHVGGEAPGSEPITDVPILNYEQLCGPVDPATGYGTGWPQLGQNEAGQNLYVIDAVSKIVAMVDGEPEPGLASRPDVAPRAELDYAALVLDQLAGPVTADAQRHGWPQLGDRTLTDALAHVKTVLAAEDGGEPPLGHQAAAAAAVAARAADPPSSPSAARGRLRERGTRPT
jgi:hypothetical protein